MVEIRIAQDGARVIQQFREVIPCVHPWRFLVHDRDGVFGRIFDKAVTMLGGLHHKYRLEKIAA